MTTRAAIQGLTKGLMILTVACITACGGAKHVAKSKEPQANGLITTHVSDNDRIEQQYFIDGCRFRIEGEPVKAIAQFEQCLKVNPKNDAAMFQIANAYNDQKDYAKAIEYLTQAIRLNGTNKWYRILAADVYETQGNYGAAADQLHALSQQFPDDANYLYDYAYFLVRNNEADKAIDVYNRIEKKAGVTEEISVQKEKLWLKLGKPDKAIEEIQRLKNTYPNEPQYSAMLADLYNAAGMHDKAMSAVKDLASADSTNAQAQLAMADYYARNNQWDKTFNALKIAFADNRVDVDTKVKTLLNYFPHLTESDQRASEAIELGKILERTHPNEAKAWAVYGDVLAQVHHDNEALDAYQHALKLDDSRFPVWQQTMLIESGIGMKDSLLATSQRAAELFPDQPMVYYFNGLAKAQLKQYQPAVQSFERLLAMGSDDKNLLSQVYASVADCYHALDNDRAADSCYEQSLVYDPQNVYTLNNYAYYLAQRGIKLDKAEKMSATVVNTLAPNEPNYLDTYAWVLYKAGRYSDAKTWQQKALANSKTDNPSLLDHYGDILYQLKDVNGAVQQWQKALTAGGDKDKLERKIREQKTSD